jgi:hypothetical protein
MCMCDSEHISGLCLTLYQSDPQVCLDVMEKLLRVLQFMYVVAEASKGTGLTLSSYLKMNGFLKGIEVDLHEFPSSLMRPRHWTTFITFLV